MPQSFTCLDFHVIFGTKHHQPMITEHLRPRLYEYIGGILRERDSDPGANAPWLLTVAAPRLASVVFDRPGLVP